MTDEERAEWLARAIDRLLTDRPVPAPAGLGAQELEALIRVAKARLASGQAGAQAALHHESTVWQQVLARLQERRQHAASAEAQAQAPNEPAQGEARELRHIVALRKQLADDMTSLAERHRESVWQQVQSRILSAGRERAPLPFLHPSPALAGGQRDSELVSLCTQAAGGSPAGQHPAQQGGAK